MDDETLQTFKDDWVEGTQTTITDPVNLTSDERMLYQVVKENNIRLEQEKISYNFVKEKLGRHITDQFSLVI